MQQIQHLSLTWMHRPAREKPEQPLEPLALPDRARIRRLAEIYHSQMKQAQRETGRVDEIARQQSEALRQFMIELTEADANAFINSFTEESSALEREWLARQREFRPPSELSPTFVRALIFVVTILAIGLAIAYAV
jgi:flagellar biosynthesis protein FliP